MSATACYRKGEVNMNRELKFKALDKIDNKVKDVINIDFSKNIVGLYYLDESKKEYLPGVGEFYTDTYCERKLSAVALMEYTGIKDKNDVELYEGYIYNMGDKNILYTVVWNDTGFMGKQLGSNSYDGLSHLKEKIEIVGNIYENAELINS